MMKIDCVFKFLDENVKNISQIYKWKLPKSLPEGFEIYNNDDLAFINIELRKYISSLLNKSNNSKELQSWYIKSWGGVKSNKPATLESYIAKSDVQLIDLGFKGIASWSKILSIRNPLAYAIYDARVAFSLNAIQAISDGQIKFYFENLPSRNSKISVAITSIEKKINSTPPNFSCTYSDYLELLKNFEQSRRINDGLQYAEMALFAAAPSLATKITRID